MRHRSARILWVLASQGHNRADLLWGESRGRSTTRSIGEYPLFYAAVQLPRASFLCYTKTLFVLQPYPAPQTSRFPIDPESVGDLLVVVTLCGGQDDARSAHQPLSTVSPTRQVHQHLALSFGEDDRLRPWSWHNDTSLPSAEVVSSADGPSITGGQLPPRCTRWRTQGFLCSTTTWMRPIRTSSSY